MTLFTASKRSNASRRAWPIGWGLINLLFSVLLIIGAIWVVLNRQAVLDWWTLVHYTPSADVQQLAKLSGMANVGRDMFYVSDPKVQASNDFSLSCNKASEQTIVLGCYVGQKIFIFDVTNAKLAGVKEVTAAHEMLHAAYERLDAATKTKVDALIQTEIGRIKDAHLQQLIDLYNKNEPGELGNEMHSILGTEYSDLSPELERYYSRYFSDRSKVVSYAKSYQAVFTASQARIADLDIQLANLKEGIDSNYSQLAKLKISLDTQASQLDRLKDSDQQQYNKMVPGYNAGVASYNSLAAATRDLISRYNILVEQRNTEVVAQNNLYQSLNSKVQTVPVQ